MRPAFNQAGDHAAIEQKTVMAVEKILRKVRAFARLVIGNKAEADEIVEDALILYLSTDPEPDEAERSYAFLIDAVRRLLRTSGTGLRREPDLDDDLKPLLQLPLQTREIAALHLGAGLAVEEVAVLLGIPADTAASELGEARTTIGDDTFTRRASGG